MKLKQQIRPFIPYFVIAMWRFRWKRAIRYYIHVQKCKRIDYFEYRKLIKSFDVFSCFHLQNLYYGNNRAIKRFDPSYKSSCSAIEHGLYFGRAKPIYDLCEGVKTIYTYSGYRENSIRESGLERSEQINIKVVGPYIRYASNFKTRTEITTLKAKLKRVLLVFPSHAIEGFRVDMDSNAFLTEIERLSCQYDTVLICMYWKDILDGKHHIYLSKGYRIVSAGHRSDPYFLSRLKDMIELSDMTMSNNIGTHIGYCVSLGRPHYIFRQEVKYMADSHEYATREWKGRNTLDFQYIVQKEKEWIYATFDTPEEQITSDQRDLVRYFWGEF